MDVPTNTSGNVSILHDNPQSLSKYSFCFPEHTWSMLTHHTRNVYVSIECLGSCQRCAVLIVHIHLFARLQ